MARCAVLLAGMLLLAPRSGAAQSAADTVLPRAGTWGGEVTMGGSGGGLSLLRFSSPRSAWLVGASFLVAHSERSPEIFADGSSFTYGWVALRAGRRWWRGADSSRIQPLLGVGASGRTSNPASDSRSFGVGAYGELGATYFFSRHVSLAASGELNVSYEQIDNNPSSGSFLLPTLTSRLWTLQGNLARITASVYF